MNDNITPLNPAMRHVKEQANANAFPAGKCFQITTMMQKTYYMTHDTEWGPTEMGVMFMKVYSQPEYGRPTEHNRLLLVGIGFALEMVPFPDWWSEIAQPATKIVRA